jgi:hypothetical protein
MIRALTHEFERLGIAASIMSFPGYSETDHVGSKP